MTRVVTYILALFIFLSAVLAVWMNHVEEFDPVRLAVELKAAGQRDQALDVLHFARENRLAPEDELIRLEQAYQYTTPEKIKDVFWTGAVKGRVTNLYSGIGAVAADLVVIGDVRDLAKEGWHMVSGQRVDKIVAALSAIGVGVTALEATGVGAVLDAGVAAAKASVKYSARLARAAPKSLLKILAAGKRMGGRVYGAVWDMFRHTNLSAPAVAVILNRTTDIRLLDSAAALTRGLKRGAAVFIDRAGTGGLKTFQRFRDLGLDKYFIQAARTNPSGVLGVTRFNTLVHSAKIVKKHSWLAPLAVGLGSLASILAMLGPAVAWLVLVLSGLYLWWRWSSRRWLRLKPARTRRRAPTRTHKRSPAATVDWDADPSSEPAVVQRGELFYLPDHSGAAPFRPANDPDRPRYRRSSTLKISPKPAAKAAPPAKPKPKPPVKPEPKPTPKPEPPVAPKPKPAPKPEPPAKPEPKPAPKPEPPAAPQPKPAPAPPAQPAAPEPKRKAAGAAPQPTSPPAEPKAVATAPKSSNQAKMEALAKQPPKSASQIVEHHQSRSSRSFKDMLGQSWASVKNINWLREAEEKNGRKDQGNPDEAAKDKVGSLPPEFELSATQLALRGADGRKQRARDIEAAQQQVAASIEPADESRDEGPSAEAAPPKSRSALKKAWGMVFRVSETGD